MAIAAEKVVDRGAELAGRLAVGQRGEGACDLGQPDLAHRGLVAVEHRTDLGPIAQARVIGCPGPESVDEEVVLDLRRFLAPHRPVVVDVGDALLDRHVVEVVEEGEDRVPARPRPARRATATTCQSRARRPWDSFSRSTTGWPVTSTPTHLMRPPVKRNGAW